MCFIFKSKKISIYFAKSFSRCHGIHPPPTPLGRQLPLLLLLYLHNLIGNRMINLPLQLPHPLLILRPNLTNLRLLILQIQQVNIIHNLLHVCSFEVEVILDIEFCEHLEDVAGGPEGFLLLTGVALAVFAFEFAEGAEIGELVVVVVEYELTVLFGGTEELEEALGVAGDALLVDEDLVFWVGFGVVADAGFVELVFVVFLLNQHTLRPPTTTTLHPLQTPQLHQQLHYPNIPYLLLIIHQLPNMLPQRLNLHLLLLRIRSLSRQLLPQLHDFGLG